MLGHAVDRKFLNDGFEPVGSSAGEFSKILGSAPGTWARVVKAANITAE